MKVKELIEQLSIYNPDAEVRVYTSNNGLFISDVVPHKDMWTHEHRQTVFHTEEDKTEYFEQLGKFLECERWINRNGSVYLMTFSS